MNSRNNLLVMFTGEREPTWWKQSVPRDEKKVLFIDDENFSHLQDP